MVLGWRRAFCTSIPPETDSATLPEDLDDDQYQQHGIGIANITITRSSTPKFGTRFPFFTSSSNPSTPRRLRSSSTPTLRCRTTVPPPPSSSLPASPKLQCQTNNSPRFFHPSSPRSPSPFSFLKSSLRLNSRRCGLCLQSVKRGQGMATFTAECSHGFHFPCISDHVKRQGSLACPVCSCLWKEMPLLSVDHENNNRSSLLFVEEVEEEEEKTREKLATSVKDDFVPKQQNLKVYNDDEPLASLTPKARFIPIPESDENCEEEEEEFRGFYGGNGGNINSPVVDHHAREVQVRILPETAAIAASRRHETYAIVLRVKAPTGPPEKSQRRAPIDLVTVVDVSGRTTTEKLPLIKRAMRSIVSSLSSSDRLSIVAFSSYSKRLLPLRRMTTSGRRSARRIVEAMAVLEGSSNSKDAVKKAVKVLEDRREKNSIAAVILLSEIVDQPSQSSSVSTTRYSHSRIDIPIHSLKLAVTDQDELFLKFIGNLLTVVVQDLRLELGFVSNSTPAAIAAVYSRNPQPIVHGSGTVRIGELSAGEERELLVELKLPLPAARSRRKISVRCCYKESSSQEIIYGKPQALAVPLPTTVRSSSPSIQRLRSLFITTRALAESRRLTDRNDLIGAYHMLISARALMQQSNPAPGDEFMLGLEAEMSELQRRRTAQARLQRRENVEMAGHGEEKREPLTPTSAWRVADKLAKVAMMRKSVNRVSDLHGFEDARF